MYYTILPLSVRLARCLYVVGCTILPFSAWCLYVVGMYYTILPLSVRLARCLYVVGCTNLPLTVRLARCLYVLGMYYPAFVRLAWCLYVVGITILPVCPFGMLSSFIRDLLSRLCLSVWHGVHIKSFLSASSDPFDTC